MLMPPGMCGTQFTPVENETGEKWHLTIAKTHPAWGLALLGLIHLTRVAQLRQVVVDHTQVLQVVEVGKVEILVVHVVHVVGQKFHHPQGLRILLVVDQELQQVLLQVQPLVLGSLVTLKVGVEVDLQVVVVVLQGEVQVHWFWCCWSCP